MVKMPPRQRHYAGNGTGGADLPLLEPGVIEGFNSVRTARCCVPLASGCLRDFENINLEQTIGCVKVICNNDNCPNGQWMHKVCFEAWETHLLNVLRSCGRARSWSEKQRLQNLWTKKGYDLAFKACACSCGKGHLRKDLNWNEKEDSDDESRNRKKKKNKAQHGNQKVFILNGNISPPVTYQTSFNLTDPTTKFVTTPFSRQKSVSPPTIILKSVPSPVIQSQKPASPTLAPIQKPFNPLATIQKPASPPMMFQKIFSPGSNSGTATPTMTPAYPIVRYRTNSISSTGSNSPLNSPPPVPYQRVIQGGKKTRHGSGGSLFARRADFSVFNALPKNKINSYHIKLEDDGFHGNDETRSFILATMSAVKSSHAACVLCNQSLAIFDRYPLIDGTFFLTPIQHSKNVVPVEIDGRRQYLSAACMGCLEGWVTTLKCIYCHAQWDGSSLILGTMYSFDIFAAMPCCRERLQCNRCENVVIGADQRLPFFSEFSRSIACPHCSFIDHHFVKPFETSFYRGHTPFTYSLKQFTLDLLS